MKKTERIITIILLFVIGLSNFATPVSYAAQLEISSLPKTATKSATQNILAASPKFRQPDTGSVLGDSTSLFEIGTQEANQTSASQRVPIRMQQLPKKVYQTDEDVTLAVSNPDNDPFITSVRNAKGQAVNVPISESDNGTTTNVSITGSNEITPGKYTIDVTDGQGNVLTQNFSWGVLAMNFDKDEYHPKEAGNISFGVLDDDGNMVCNAQLSLHITNNEAGIDDVLSTQDASSSAKTITVNPQCQKHDFSLQPDYQASYTFTKEGTYTMQLSAQTQNGIQTITNTIQVTNNTPFDIQRISATRIYPPNTYPMTFNITAHQDFSGTITETVPQDFIITPATESAQFSSGSTPTSYDDMETMYLNTQNPAIQLQQAIATTSAGLVMPFQGNYPITQGFGAQMTDPTLQAFYTQYGLAGHDGVDFGVPMDTPLYAVDDGNVMQAGPGDYGTTIIIRHAWGESYYGHLSNTAVNVGEHVTKGELIGYSGESGEATGPHLHFGIRPNNPDMLNGYYGKVDPLQYLPYNQTPQPIASLGPTLPLLNSSPVLGASTSASPEPSSIPTLFPTRTITPTTAPTAQASVSAIPIVSQSPDATPSASTQSQPTTTITTSTNPPANTVISVLDKQIFLNEQIANSTQTEKVKVITWNVSLKKGQTTSLGYDFKAPPQSPQFYLLGPLQFYANGSDKVIFQEQRAWQIASDDVGVEWYSNTTNSSWNGYSWQYRKKIDVNSSEVSTAPSGIPNALTIGHDADSSSTSSSWSHTTTSSQSNLIMIVGITSGSNPSGITYGSKSLTEIANTNASGLIYGSLWYLVNPQTGTNTVSVSGAGTFYSGGASTYYNVNQSTPIGSSNTNTASAVTSVSVTVSSTNTGQLVVDSMWNGSNTNTITPGTGQTRTWNNSGGSILPSAGSYKTGVSSSTAMSWTVSNANGADIIEAAALNPASAIVGPSIDFMESGSDATHNLSFYTGNNFSTGTGSSSSDCTTAETGSCSIKLNAGTGTTTLDTGNGAFSSTAGRVSFYFETSAIPTGANVLHFFNIYSGTNFDTAPAELLSSDVIACGNGTTSGTTAIAVNTWYRVSIGYTVSGTAITYNLYLNGKLEVACNSISLNGFNSPNNMGFTSDVANTITHIDDVYADSDSDLSDTGDIHVTAKLPVTSAANNYSTQGTPSGFTSCTSGTQCEYVNERPLNTGAYVQSTTNSQTQSFGIQGASQGDSNIPSNAGIVGDQAWLYLSSSAICSSGNAAIINNGVSTNITLPTSNSMVTNYSNSQTFPSNNGAVGMTSCSSGTAPTINLYEAGTQIAYIPDLINFPVLVNLSSDTDLKNHAQNNGSDILFTDSTGENLLPFEIESYSSSTGSLQAWVNISSLSTSNDTIIYMYYGNPSATSQANPHGTWNSNYGGVWHFPNGTTLSLNDSTSNGSTGTNNGSVTATSGEIGGAANFTGSSQYIGFPNNNLFNPGTNSFSGTFWVNPTGGNGSGAEIMGNLNSGAQGWLFYVFNNTTGTCNITDPICFFDGTNHVGVTSPLSFGSWQQVGFTKSGTTVTFYYNGSSIGSQTVVSSIPSSTGTENVGGDANFSAIDFNGSIDEPEYSTTALSSGWIQTEYNNQGNPGPGAGDFVSSLGSVETDIYAPLLTQMLRHGQFFGTVGNESGVLQPFTW